MIANISPLPVETPPRTFPRPVITLAVIVLYGVGAIALFRPLGPFSTDYLPRGGMGDPAQMIWFLAYTPHAISHGLNIFSTQLIDYPTGVDLANNTSAPLLGIISWPITATLGPIASFNFLMRLAIFCSATSLYVVLGRWCSSRLARFIGGLCFGFGPYIISQSVDNTHINLLFIPLFPLIVWLLFELFDTQKRRWWWAGLGLGLCVSAQMWIDPELLSDFGIVALCVVVLLAIIHPSAIRTRITYAIKALIAAVVVVGASCGYLLFEMFAGSQHLRGPVYAVSHLQSFHNNLYETFVPTLRQLFSTTDLSTSSQLPTRDINEIGGYLSVPLVIVLICGYLLWRHRGGTTTFFLGIVIAFVLSLGDAMHIGTTKIPLPEDLFTHIPLLQSTVPGRISLDTMLACCCLFAITIDESLKVIAVRPRTVRRYGYSVLALVVAVVIAAQFPRLPIREQPFNWPTTTGSEIAAHVAPDAVVLFYPYPISPLDSAMIWQAETGFGYRVLGAYATVAGADGIGQEWPVSQRPLQIQEYLNFLERGRSSRYPQPKAPLSTSKLCTYALRYNISDVVILHSEVNALAATTYLTKLPHTVVFNNKSITIYRVLKHNLGNRSSSC